MFSTIITQLFASDYVVTSKSLLLAIVDHIIVKKSEIEVKGANLKLLNVVSETKMWREEWDEYGHWFYSIKLPLK